MSITLVPFVSVLIRLDDCARSCDVEIVPWGDFVE